MPNLSTHEMQRRPSWLQIVKNTVDQYDDPIHGVQKDAIQNGKDAIPLIGRKKDDTLKEDYVKKNWKFSFELKEIMLHEGGLTRVLMMTDFGTTGLIGNRRVEDFNSNEEIPLEEKWARFESYAVANEGGQTGGSRGQGKFVFVWASNEKKIIYDTRTIKGKYRVGYTTVSTGQSPVFAWDGKDGEEWIRKECGIEPIHSDGVSGTRIIIIDPNNDLVSRIKSGIFLENIQETWWPFIRDFSAHIEVIVDGVASVAVVPEIINKIYSDKDNDDIKHWNKNDLKFKFGQWKGSEYTIKELRIASIKSGNVPEDYKGIAIFRGGMKVQTVQPLYGYEFEDRITGYVLSDYKIDEKLREIEKPSHYEFNNSGIWKKLESVIKEQTKKFGFEKLGIGITSSINNEEKRQASISKALQIFRFISKDWPLDIGGIGVINKPHKPTKPVLIKNRYVSIKDFIFPNPANLAKLDWDQTISGWWLEVGNYKSPNIDLQLESWVSSPSGEILFGIVNERISLKPDSVVSYKGNKSGFEILASKDIFSGSGKYQLHAKITDLKTKNVVDEIGRFFWIDMEPPFKGPFEILPASFSQVLQDQIEIEWKLEYREDGKTLFYNTDHPSFITASQQGSEDIFLGELAGMAGIQLLIENVDTLNPDEARLQKLPFDYDVLFGRDATTRYLETIKMRDRIRHKILSNYLE